METTIKSHDYMKSFNNTVDQSKKAIASNKDEIHYFYTQEKTKALEITVISHLKDDYKVVGVPGTIYSYINKTVTRKELLSIKEMYNLLHEQELGQADLFEYLEG